MKLQEHIDLYRRLRIPFKRQFLTLALEVARQHYNQELDQLVDVDSKQTMTVKEFVEACMTPEPAETPPVTPIEKVAKRARKTKRTKK